MITIQLPSGLQAPLSPSQQIDLQLKLATDNLPRL